MISIMNNRKIMKYTVVIIIKCNEFEMIQMVDDTGHCFHTTQLELHFSTQYLVSGQMPDSFVGKYFQQSFRVGDEK
jgi:hypothetical protein